MKIQLALRRAVTNIRYSEPSPWRDAALGHIFGGDGEVTTAISGGDPPSAEAFGEALGEVAMHGAAASEAISDVAIEQAWRVSEAYAKADEGERRKIIFNLLRDTAQRPTLLTRAAVLATEHGGSTIKALAESTSQGYETVKRLVRGETANPRPDTVQAVAVAISNAIYDAILREWSVEE